MPSNSDRLKTALENVSNRLVEVTATYRPTYSIDGESYSHETYLNSLIASVASLQAAIQNLDGPYQKNTRMRT
jgi:hypothetical protein